MKINKEDIIKTPDDYIEYYMKIDEYHSINTDVFENKIVEYFGKIDYYQFTWNELYKIGLTTWDDELILIPRYQYPCIIDGTILRGIDGVKIVFEEGVTDDDERFGYLGYGISRDDLKVINREKTINKIIEE